LSGSSGCKRERDPIASHAARGAGPLKPAVIVGGISEFPQLILIVDLELLGFSVPS